MKDTDPNEPRFRIIEAIFWVFVFTVIGLGWHVLSANESGGVECRLDSVLYSDHSPGGNYNEKHEGVGLECQFNSEVWYGVIPYVNSYYDDSLLLKVSREWQTSDNWYVGVAGGAATGYGPPISPFVALHARYRWIRVHWTPAAAQNVTWMGLVIDF